MGALSTHRDNEDNGVRAEALQDLKRKAMYDKFNRMQVIHTLGERWYSGGHTLKELEGAAQITLNKFKD